MKVDIPLGFEVGTGEPVAIPLGHMAVTGQTQAAGKTTTLEALAHRLPADHSLLAFVTKRGEGSFGAVPGSDVRATRPYFRERADWQFVEAMLEAVMRERMKFERTWIMRLSKNATNLRNVHANCKHELQRAKSQFARDMYEKLDAYFDIVVPQIERIAWAPTLTLTPGLNVMNLQAMSTELQALVIGSCLDAVLAQGTQTIVVVPEAWEFVPRGRKSPVTLSAEAFARKGAALKNYLWIDSQDLAGVHTPLLKQMHVFLLGVQREKNEITRTIAHLHGPARPKPDTIAQLGLGQFVACWGSHAITTYVQPAWAWASAAQEAAKVGGRAGVHDSVHVTAGTRAQFATRMPALEPTQTLSLRQPVQGQQEDPMDAQLKAENAELKLQNQHYAETIAKLQKEVATMRDRIAFAGEPPPARRDYDDPSTTPPPRGDGAAPVVQDAMMRIHWPTLRSAIISAILNDEQVLAKIATIRPEIIVETAPRVQTLDGSSLKGRLAKLIAAGFFDEPIKAGVANKELNRTGGTVHPANLGRALNDFVLEGYVTRENGDQYQKARALKITTRELTAVS